MGDVPQVNGEDKATEIISSADSAAYSGAQSISRAFRIFRAVAKAGEAGLRLRDAAAEVQLNSSTTHRLLMALVTERVIMRDPLQRRYRIAAEFLRSMDNVRDADLARQYGEVMRYVAAKTGESTYLSVPAGTDIVCVARILGASVIQPIPFDIGGRRPFGIGSAGIVALAAMPEHRINSILVQHAPAFQSYGLTSEDIGALVRECRSTGFCYNPGLFIKGVGGIGVPIINGTGHLIGILNIVALEERLRSEHQRLQIASLIREAINRASEAATF